MMKLLFSNGLLRFCYGFVTLNSMRINILIQPLQKIMYFSSINAQEMKKVNRLRLEAIVRKNFKLFFFVEILN